MKIRTQVFSTVLVMFVLLITIGLSLFYRINVIKHDVTMLNTKLNKTLSVAIELDLTFHKYKESWKNILLRGHTEGRYQTFLNNFYKNERKLYAELNELKNLLDYDSALFIPIDKLRDDIKLNSKSYRKALKIYFESDRSVQELADMFTDSEHALSVALSDIRQAVTMLSNDKLNKLEIDLGSKLMFNFIFSALLTILCIALLLYILNIRIIRPIEYAISVVNRLKNKEEHVRMKAIGNNEFSIYSASFNSMLDSIELQKKQLEKSSRQLMEAEKLAALGDLVAGVAHELNTPLGIGLTASTHVNDSTKILKKSADEGKLTKRQLDQYITNVLEGTKVIEGNIYKANEIITTFKQVAVDQSSENRRIFDIKKCIEENVFNMNLKHKAIDHEINVTSESYNLDSFPGPLGQVIVNLINNSFIHGFSDGRFGMIDIVIKAIDANYIEITYQDNGKGMTPAVLSKMFDPFFTTAEDNKGTGLGMPIVLNIIKKVLQGNIQIESSLGNGFKAIITIPKQVTE
jgi:signal transduction histidine kinase